MSHRFAISNKGIVENRRKLDKNTGVLSMYSIGYFFGLNFTWENRVTIVVFILIKRYPLICLGRGFRWSARRGRIVNKYFIVNT